MTGPPLLVVFDAASGSDDARLRLAESLRASGRAHQVFVAERGDDLGAVTGRAVHAARAAGGAVVVAGGDGAIHAVAQAVWNARLPFGLLPQGVPSAIAQAYGVPAGADEAFDALLRAQPRPVPVGQVGERLFLLDASLGLHPRRLSGLGAAWRAGPFTLELHAHGEVRVAHTHALRVGNVPPPLAASVPPPLPWPVMLWRLARGGLDQDADRFAFDRLVVRPRRGRQVEMRLDGERVCLDAPLVFQAAPHPLQLLA